MLRCTLGRCCSHAIALSSSSYIRINAVCPLEPALRAGSVQWLMFPPVWLLRIAAATMRILQTARGCLEDRLDPLERSVTLCKAASETDCCSRSVAPRNAILYGAVISSRTTPDLALCRAPVSSASASSSRAAFSEQRFLKWASGAQKKPSL